MTQRIKTFNTWRGMIERCTDKNNKCYKDYGGRGITVDARWLSFEAFIADMGLRPVGRELDRKDINQGYCKDNCQWLSHKENSQKKRNTKLSAEKVRLMFALYKSIRNSVPRNRVHPIIADVFKVSLSTVMAVYYSKRWSND